MYAVAHTILDFKQPAHTLLSQRHHVAVQILHARAYTHEHQMGAHFLCSMLERSYTLTDAASHAVTQPGKCCCCLPAALQHRNSTVAKATLCTVQRI